MKRVINKMEDINKIWKKIKYFFEYYILNLVNLFVVKNDNYIAFGSWLGKNYTDNPRYLFEYLIQLDKGYKLIWIGELDIKDQIPKNDNVIFCRIHSIKSIYYIMKSKYVVFCQDIRDLYPVNFYNKTIKIYLDHGIPVKKWELDVLDVEKNLPLKVRLKRTLTKIHKTMTGGDVKYDYFIAASPLHAKCISSALKNHGAKEDNIISSGTPRNDYLFERKDKDNYFIKEKYANLLNFDPTKRVVLYAPAYRRYNTKIESFSERSNDEIEKIKSILEKNDAILIEKNHFRTYTQNKISGSRDQDNTLIKLPENNIINIQEMLLFTDILITDYSGVFFDYVILDKPMIHYAFDYDYYKTVDTGLYYEIEDFSGGKVTETFDETCKEIDELLKGKDNYKDKRKYVKDKYLEYEKGKASEIIYKTAIKKNI